MASDIPPSVRRAVDERDDWHCRLCGAYAGAARQQHHVIFGGDARGVGGRRQHVVEEIVSLCLACHGRAHAEKSRWQKYLLAAIAQPSFTAMQLQRWDRS